MIKGQTRNIAFLDQRPIEKHCLFGSEVNRETVYLDLRSIEKLFIWIKGQSRNTVDLDLRSIEKLIFIRIKFKSRNAVYLGQRSFQETLFIWIKGQSRNTVYTVFGTKVNRETLIIYIGVDTGLFVHLTTTLRLCLSGFFVLQQRLQRNISTTLVRNFFPRRQ